MDFLEKNSKYINIILTTLTVCLVVVFLVFFKFSNHEKNITPQENFENTTKKTETRENNFSFAILGDTQLFDSPESKGGFIRAVENISKENISFVMTVGDLVQKCETSNECENKYEKWHSVAKKIPVRIYPVMGNHDRANEKAADKMWQDYFKLPLNGPQGYEELTYSFNFRNSHFIVLNSEKPRLHRIDAVQREWLENDLKENKTENVFVFFHEPAFPGSYGIGKSLDIYEKDREALWKIIDKYNVTAVFNGHEHIYSRRIIDASVFSEAVNNIRQFIVGNTDAYERVAFKQPNNVDFSYNDQCYAIINIRDKNIVLYLYAVDGNLIETFIF